MYKITYSQTERRVCYVEADNRGEALRKWEKGEIEDDTDLGVMDNEVLTIEKEN